MRKLFLTKNILIKITTNIIIFLMIILQSKIFCIDQFPELSVYSGYSEDSFVIFINPSGSKNLSRIDFGYRYGQQFSGLLVENRISNTDIILKYNYKKLNFGLGYRGISVEDIYSEEMIILNFGTDFFKKRLQLGLNLKNYLYRYFLDNYYLLDTVANSSQQSMNMDLGFRYEISEKFYSAISYNNALKTVFGQMVKYSFPQMLVLGFGYRFYSTILNLEFINTSYEINSKIFNENKYRFGAEQTIFGTKNFVSTIKFGIDKTEEHSAFILSPAIKTYSPAIEIQYLWKYPVTNIKNYFGNHFIILKFSFGTKHSSPFSQHYTTQAQVLDDLEEKNAMATTILKQERQIKQLEESIKKLEKNKEEKQVIISTKTVIVPVEISTETMKLQKEVKVVPVLQKPKFPLAHKVSSGETLISIAEKYYNNKKYWTKIYDANKDKVIKGVLIVGETIIIPEP
ncbi:MAG: LysM peptidoglycan-binding domain-containing protein [Endomicrobiia bacterium]